MKAIFNSTTSVNLRPLDTNETVLLQNLVEVAENNLELKMECGEGILAVKAPEVITDKTDLIGKTIKMSFPKVIKQYLEPHKIFEMKDGSYIECIVAYPEPPIPEIKWEATGNVDPGMGTKEIKCSCGMIKNVWTSTDLNDPSLTTDHAEEHKEYYLEHYQETEDPGFTCSPTIVSTIPVGYYSDPTAPNGYRECRPGHIHGATYIWPDCNNITYSDRLMKRTVIVRLVSETLGTVVLYSLVGISDIRVNMELFKVNTTVNMDVETVNTDSIFYDCFKI